MLLKVVSLSFLKISVFLIIHKNPGKLENLIRNFRLHWDIRITGSRISFQFHHTLLNKIQFIDKSRKQILIMNSILLQIYFDSSVFLWLRACCFFFFGEKHTNISFIKNSTHSNKLMMDIPTNNPSNPPFENLKENYPKNLDYFIYK